MKIASALGKTVARNIKGVPYYEVSRNGKNIVVACAVGHLFTLKQNGGNGQKLPVFDISWVPNYIARKGSDFTKKYYDTISKLVNLLEKENIKNKVAKIGVLGISYKANLADMRESPALKIISRLKKMGFDVPVIKASVKVRDESDKDSKDSPSGFRNKIVAAMRWQFGRHPVKITPRK